MQPAETNGMTQLMYQMAASQALTMPEAIEKLKQDAVLRSIREILQRFMGEVAGDQLGPRLIDALMASDPQAKKDSVSRKVRMWLKEDVWQISRESALQVAFALKLKAENANQLLLQACEQGFHWRDPQDLIYIFALEQKMNWQEATALTERIRSRGLLSSSKGEEAAYTAQLRSEAALIHTEEELMDFLREHAHQLGTLHHTAHALFLDFLQLLGWKENKKDASPKESKKQERDPMEDDPLTMRDILTTYFYHDLVPQLKHAGKAGKAEKARVFSALQRDLRANFPDETMLSKMLHREMDVSRKVLILLFLATDGGESEYGDLSDEMSPEEIFEDRCERLNMMLVDCGFGPLDSRSRFDWMVLYCICVDDSLYIDGRIQRFLSEIFPEGKIEQKWAGFDSTERKSLSSR